MSFIKKNKYTIIVIVAFIFVVFIGAKAMQILVPNEGKAIYGDRLAGIEEVKIKDTTMEQALGQLKENAMVVDASQVTRGKLVTFIVTVTDETSTESSKTLADVAIASFGEDQKSYYDFQVIIQKNDEALNDFPIIAYKHHNQTNFVWTKDRVVSAE